MLTPAAGVADGPGAGAGKWYASIFLSFLSNTLFSSLVLPGQALSYYWAPFGFLAAGPSTFGAWYSSFAAVDKLQEIARAD